MRTDTAQRQRQVHGDDPDFEGITCPDCQGTRLELVSLFGGAASEVLFRCLGCHHCFNWVKWRGRLPPTA